MSGTKSFDEVMFAFSVEPQHNATTLARYLQTYPEFAADLVDLAHELNFSASLGPSDAPLEEDAGAQAAWLQYAAVKPTFVLSEPAQSLFDTIKGETFVALADALGVPRSVLVALRDRLVEPASIPHAFIRRFASAMNRTVDVVQQYLSLPPMASAAVNFKADQKPAVQNQITFKALLEQTNLTEEQQLTLQKDFE
jgi:hypothetical protein